MSDFISNGEDYVDYIKNEEDLKKFNRMKELEKELHKPAAECLDAVIEYTNLERSLRGVPPVTFIKQGNPKYN